MACALCNLPICDHRDDQWAGKLSVASEPARTTAFFQLRTIAAHMGADPEAVDPRTLTLSITSPAARSPSAAGNRGLVSETILHDTSPLGPDAHA